jgi:hypothetical protein
MKRKQHTTQALLHKEQIQDVRNSGITDSMVRASRLETVIPGDISKLMGWNHPDINHCYKIPNLDAQGKEYCFQLKVFPPVKGNNGSTLKYVTPKGMPAKPYIAPGTWDVCERTNKPLWIVEGVKKALKLAQHGEKAIALLGVYNFRAGKDSTEKEENKYLWGEIRTFNFFGRTVYLAFDADLWDNPQVRDALWELALKLFNLGANIYFVSWKQSEGKGIDDHIVNKEKAKEKAEDVLNELKEKAKPLEKFVSSIHRNAIMRALSITNLSPLNFESIVKPLSRALHVSIKSIYHELANMKPAPEPDIPTDDERQQAMELLSTGDIIPEFLSTCRQRYIGREELLTLLKLATVSRKFSDMNFANHVFIKGPSSTGKSEAISTVLDTVSPEGYENFSYVSPKYLLYREKPIENLIIIFYEINGASQALPLIRSIISEQAVSFGSVAKNERGEMAPIEVKKPARGTVIFTTYTATSIDYETSTRVIEAEIEHDEGIARRVMELKARKAEGKSDKDVIPVRIWQVADALLEAKPVVIPFADKLAKIFPVNRERYVRDYPAVLSLIRASALLHQYQRKQIDNVIYADRRDYDLVYDLREIISESSSAVSEGLLEFLAKAQELSTMSTPTRIDLEQELNKSDSTLKRYIRKAKRDGFIETDGRGAMMKITVRYIPEKLSPLPKPENIFYIASGDPLTQTMESEYQQGFSQCNPHLNPHDPNDPNDPDSGQTGQTGQGGSNGVDPSNLLENKENIPFGSTGHQKGIERF